MERSVFSFEALYRSYIACRRHKRNSDSALRFEWQAERRLFGLQDALNRRVYRPSRYACFVTRDPKLREIFAAPFSDRIVHHLLVARLEPAWERRMIYDVWSGRRGKGLHGAVDRLQGFCRQATHNGSRRAWFLKLDIRSLFTSIPKRPLYHRLCAMGLDDDTTWLLRTLLFHDVTRGVLYKSPPWLIDQVPRHKSLLHAPPDRGLPIGNLISQFFANVYLDDLDQFIKHQLHGRHYLRYMDDMVLLHPDRSLLASWHKAIGASLPWHFGLSLNPAQTRLRPVSNGIDFLGYIIRPQYRLVRRRVVGAMKRRLAVAE